MQTYLIDAFNLFHKIDRLEASASPHEDLIRYIRAKGLTGSEGNRVIIVFDGFEPPTRPRDAGFDIRYSNNRTADEVIRSIIERAPDKRNIVVVSDDREIRSAAGINGATICRIREFLSPARKRRAKRAESADADDKDIPPSKMMDITEEMTKRWVGKE